MFSSYKLLFGPALLALGNAGYGCRFSPSCSEYAREAFEVHSPLHAFALTVARLLRCNPWNSSSGFDPVPPCGCEVF